MISIIIPLYNKENYIARTLNSVLAQTFQHFEVVIVNDGSTDNSVSKVEKFTDARIRLIHQQNAGVSATRNRGIEEAKYELIAFLDADDEWKPDYLQTQYGLYQKYPECSVYACNYELCESNGKITPTLINKLPFRGADGVLNNYFEVASCSHPPLWTSAVIVKKAAIQSIGGFPVGIKSGEDLLTWARLAVKYKVAYTISVQAIFNLDISHSLTHKPTRLHDEGDPVGKQLIILYKQISQERKSEFRCYLSLWFKMKVSVYLRINNARLTWKYGLRSLYYNYKNYKVYAMLFIVLLPHNIQDIIISKYAKP